MTYNSSYDLFLEQTNQEERNNPHSNSASVPIALYRQLAEELKVTQTRLQFTEQKNRKLAQENEQLKQELANLLQQGQDLKEIINNFQFSTNYPLANPKMPINVTTPGANFSQESPLTQNKTKKKKSKISQTKKFAEIQPSPLSDLSISVSKESKVIFVTIALIFIVLTTFGAGLMLINTLLSNQK